MGFARRKEKTEQARTVQEKKKKKKERMENKAETTVKKEEKKSTGGIATGYELEAHIIREIEEDGLAATQENIALYLSLDTVMEEAFLLSVNQA